MERTTFRCELLWLSLSAFVLWPIFCLLLLFYDGAFRVRCICWSYLSSKVINRWLGVRKNEYTMQNVPVTVCCSSETGKM